MLGKRRYSAGIHVRRRTELERDPLVADVGGERTELDHLAFADGHVLDEPHAMANAMRAAVLQRLPDRRRSECFARVDGDGKVLAAAELERLDVSLRRVPGLLAGDIEADDTSFPIRHGELGHLKRIGAIAHGADQLAQRDAVVALRALEPARHALDDLLEVEPARGVEYRRV